MKARLEPGLAAGLPPAWAVGWGEDRFGSFADLGVGRVVQRMRWMPPGRFWMGSPAAESWRSADEGPRHAVELTRGFWLGDTPVTQELWFEVMGGNPSRFKSSTRPVEGVSWFECVEFCGRLSAQLAGGGVRLPTEAEWEYACRAGTEGSTWRGELEVRGANDAPLLDGIAWYGGNSGDGFELDNGYDSSRWPEKQVGHTRAGTRPVRGKAANPWGLYDMLGNVYEWCEDAYEGYSEEARVDPVARTGAARVLRGGSWYSAARDVRAAYRYWFPPGYRYVYLGFRLARGPSATEDR